MQVETKEQQKTESRAAEFIYTEHLCNQYVYMSVTGMCTFCTEMWTTACKTLPPTSPLHSVAHIL